MYLVRRVSLVINLNIIRPNAKQFQLVVPSVNIGAVIDIRFSRVFKNGVPLDPKFYRIVKGGISSEASLVNQVEKQSYFFSNGYFISYAPPGSFPNCRGCNKKLLNKGNFVFNSTFGN